MNPERITQHPTANEQLLYFTSSSLWSDDSHLVFISDRTGHPNVFSRNLATGEEMQLTHNTEGSLKSYVYFDGTPYRGLGKASISLHSQSGTLYYIQGREIRKVLANGTNLKLAEYPAGQMTAFTHVSADGKRVCVPTTDARALDGDTLLPGRPDYNIDERVQNESLNSYLRVYDTDSGEEILCERVPKAWITHVQFSPVDNTQILYNHEWPADCGIRRVWLFDGQRHIRLRPEGDSISRNDWACHEMWERDGQQIIYHGGYENKGNAKGGTANGAYFIGRVRPDGSERFEIALPANYRRYGHFTVSDQNLLVSDGYYETEADPVGNQGGWICTIAVDWQTGSAEWTPLCRNGSSWDSQDSHPHPIFDHACKYIYFTSDMDGKRAVYRVKTKA